MKKLITYLIVLTTCAGILSCNSSTSSDLETKVKSLETELQKYKSEKDLTEQRIVRFDSLDFDIYSKQKWEDLNISHDENILVHYPDGHTTGKLSPHVDELKAMFVFAPDTKVAEHPVKFGSGEWTCVIGRAEGTFIKPMPIGGSKFIPPTGKKFSMQMVTIGKWKEGKMVEEYLFWDNAGFAKQIGLGN